MASSNNDFVGVLEADFNGQDLRIGIVQARFNEEHCVALTTACIKELISLGVAQSDIKLVTVPGALGSFEILNHHAPIISTLENGKVIVRTNESTQNFHTKGGVVEVIHNKVIVLAEGIIEE